MSTDASFIEYVCEQASLGKELSHRKMFGEYALYLHDRVVALVCDNQVFLKNTPAGATLAPAAAALPPYKGAKPHLRLAGELDDRDLLRRLFVATAAALPLPKPRPGRKSTPKSKRSRAAPR